MAQPSAFAALLPLFQREQAADRALVLATIVRTAGSTYRKAGAQMLIAGSGEFSGLLSGGCLEGDLREHASEVLKSGIARLVQYDMRSEDDMLFGLGAGCEGAMDILLQRVDASVQWQPLAYLAQCWQRNESGCCGLVFDATDAALIGSVVLTEGEAASTDSSLLAALRVAYESRRVNQLHTTAEGHQLFVLHSAAPFHLLILGAGPDAQPVTRLAQFLGWKSTVYDHRSAYATIERFPYANEVVLGRAAEVGNKLDLSRFNAVVVMSHHLESDQYYLRGMAHSDIPYIGLLGPAARRERLFSELSDCIELLKPRLHAPVGLAIGAATPESIALSIVSEIHATIGRVTIDEWHQVKDQQTKTALT